MKINVRAVHHVAMVVVSALFWMELEKRELRQSHGGRTIWGDTGIYCRNCLFCKVNWSYSTKNHCYF